MVDEIKIKEDSDEEDLGKKEIELITKSENIEVTTLEELKERLIKLENKKTNIESDINYTENLIKEAKFILGIEE
jgi:hypothetical protein